MIDSFEKEMNDAYYLLTSRGYDVIYIGLYGSQNYNLHDEDSDVDLRVIVMPDLTDLIINKKTSKSYIYDYGKIDVKDLWTYYSVVKKGNPSFIEPLVSEHWLGEPYIREIFKDVKPNAKALYGMMLQKIKRYKKEKDPKDFHHTVRIENMFYTENGVINTPQKSYEVYNNIYRERMIDFKRGRFPGVSNETIDNFFEVVNIGCFLKNYTYEPIKKDNEIIEYIKGRLECQLDLKSTKK